MYFLQTVLMTANPGITIYNVSKKGKVKDQKYTHLHVQRAGLQACHKLYKFRDVLNFSGTFGTHSVWFSYVFLTRKTKFCDQIGQMTFFHSHLFGDHKKILCWNSTFKIAVKTFKVASTNEAKSLHDCSFIGLPFTAFLGILRLFEAGWDKNEKVRLPLGKLLLQVTSPKARGTIPKLNCF